MANVNDNATRSQMGPVIFSSTIGTTIEWYDFFLYGTMSTLVFPKLFFPTSDPFVSTLLALFTFLVGFIARPFGGAFFGHLGDRIGRKGTLIATLLTMGISTLVIGFLPGYSTIGIVAPLLLVLLRLIQGLAVGGEWGGSVLLALEHGHRSNRGFWASWPQMGAPLGLVTSTVVVNIVGGLTTKAGFDAFGWRIPFFLSALLILVGLYTRQRVAETPLFAQVKESRREARAPILDAFRHSTPEILLSAGARFVEQAPFYLFTVFVISYGTLKLDLEKAPILDAITIAAFLEIFTIPLFGYLSDRIGRRIWYMIGCVLMALFAFPYFWLMNTRSVPIYILAVVLSLTVFHSWVYGPQAALISERFGTRARYSGASLGYQLAAPFAGGLAPIIALLLLNGKSDLGAMGLKNVVINLGSGSWQAVAIYMIVLAAISLLSTWGLKELTKADISNVEANKVTDSEAVGVVSTD
ncbi:MAG: MHS family MFS transporter [Ktedonobacteraceae bacterium]|nr:MHS family MFS transporter [Ktedonobacteraceae bacterium]